MNKNLILIVCGLFLLSCSTLSTKREPAVSQPFAPMKAGDLFADDEPLHFELEAPLKEFLAKVQSTPFPQNKEIKTTGILSYINEQQQKVELPVEIQVKGFSTLMMCEFPKLELKIKSKNLTGSLFDSIKTVDLHTHCQEEEKAAGYPFLKASFYNHREALLYKMAEVLQIPTFKARPVFIRYKNPQYSFMENKEYRAFFLEDMGSFRKRLNAQEVKGVGDIMKDLTLAKDPSKASLYRFSDVKSASQVDPEDAARIALFQAMVGNGDWFLKVHPEHYRNQDRSDKSNLWNVKIVELPDKKWVLFPQDFSLSGILIGATHMILDAPNWGVVPKETQDRLRQVFVGKKSEIYDLLKTLQEDPEGSEQMRKALDNFYSNLLVSP